MLTSGSLNYQNVDAASWDMVDDRSRLYLTTGTTLFLYTTLNLSPGNMFIEDNVTVATAAGQSLIGSILPQGIVNRVTF
jgi:hypothetical protein